MNIEMQNENRAGSASLAVLLVSALLLSALAVAPSVGQVSAAGYTEYTGTLGDAHFVVCFPDPWNGMLAVFCRGYSIGRVSDARTSLYNASAEVLLNQGFAVAASAFSTGGVCIQQAMNDTYWLTNHLIDMYHVTGKVFLIGGSMGGNIALLLGEEYPNVYSGVLDMFGPKDYKLQYELKARWANLSDAELTAELAALNLSMPIFMFSSLAMLRSFCAIGAADIVEEMGGTPDNASQAYEDRSPVYRAAISIPVITLHGLSDPIVPYSQSLLFRDAVASAGRSGLYRLYSVVGGQHGDPSVTAEMPSRFAELVSWSEELRPTLRASAFCNVTVLPGWTWHFFAHSSGGVGPHSYQWYEGSTLLVGQRGMVLAVSKGAGGRWTYYCRVTDGDGTTTISNPVTLTVWAPF